MEDGKLNSSGLLLTEHGDGSLTFEFVDYNVAAFCGGDYESKYDVDCENADKMRKALNALHPGRNLQEQAVCEFGAMFDTPKFELFCAEHKIKFEHFTWTSFGDD